MNKMNEKSSFGELNINAANLNDCLVVTIDLSCNN